jgi:Ulp1 family protease
METAIMLKNGKNTKMITAGYSPNRNWWNLIGTKSTSSVLPVNIHFHWNLFIFEFLTIHFDFILAAILKILKTKSTTLSDDLFLCQVSKGSAVRSVYVSFSLLLLLFLFKQILDSYHQTSWNP